MCNRSFRLSFIQCSDEPKGTFYTITQNPHLHHPPPHLLLRRIHFLFMLAEATTEDFLSSLFDFCALPSHDEAIHVLRVCNYQYRCTVTGFKEKNALQLKWPSLVNRSGKKEEIVIKMSMEGFIPFSSNPVSFFFTETPSEHSYKLKIIGDTCEEKMIFAFQLIFNMISDTFVDSSGTKLYPLCKIENKTVVNIIVRWQHMPSMLKDPNAMKRELKDFSKNYYDKFPHLFFADPHDPKKFFIVSIRGFINTAGLKSTDDIYQRLSQLYEILRKLIPKRGVDREKNLHMGTSYDPGVDQYQYDRRKLFPVTHVKQKVMATKAYNISKVSRIKDRRADSMRTQVRTQMRGNAYPSVDFYIQECEKLRYIAGTLEDVETHLDLDEPVLDTLSDRQVLFGY